jgi:hypothetical protein
VHVVFVLLRRTGRFVAFGMASGAFADLPDQTAVGVEVMPVRLHPLALQHGHDQVAHGRHRLGSHAAPNAAGILAQRDIADMVQLVLDRPVASAQTEQLRGTGPLRWQAGDLVVHLRVPAPLPPTLVHEPTDLPESGPGAPWVVQTGLGMQGPDVNAPVPTIYRPCAGCGLDRLERSAVAPARALAGCL